MDVDRRTGLVGVDNYHGFAMIFLDYKPAFDVIFLQLGTYQ